MATLKTHKELIAWQKSYSLCLKIYKIIKKMPKTEMFNLSAQIKRSSISIPSNIAEGYNRASKQEYIRFLNIAYASLAELDTQILLCKDLEYINANDFTSIKEGCDEVQRILFGLINSLKYGKRTATSKT